MFVVVEFGVGEVLLEVGGGVVGINLLLVLCVVEKVLVVRGVWQQQCVYCYCFQI